MKLRGIAGMVLIGLWLGASAASAQEAGGKKLKVLVYGGGSVHDFKGINQVVMETLGACSQLELTSVTDTVEPATAPAKPTIKSALDDMLAKLPQADVLFFHHTGGKLTPEQEDKLCGAIESGKGFVGIHSAADSFKQNAKYMDMIGGSFRTHPAFGPIHATVLVTDHPITKGLPKEFTVQDEQYILKHDPSKIQVLVQAPYELKEYKEVVEEKDGKQIKRRVPTGKIAEFGQMPAVWTKSWGKGRVVYISFCHSAPSTKQDIVKKLVLQGVLWAGQPVP